MSEGSGCPYKNMMNKIPFTNPHPKSEASSTKENKCPFSADEPTIELINEGKKEDKNIKNEEKQKGDVSSDEDEKPKGGCPMMGKGILILK